MVKITCHPFEVMIKVVSIMEIVLFLSSSHIEISDNGCWTVNGGVGCVLGVSVLAAIETKLESLRLLSRVKSWAESNNSLSLRLVHLSHGFTCDRWTAFHVSLIPA